MRKIRIAEIDGLRGISLTLVVIFHLFGHGRVSGGVDVFLTVSGFLLTLSLGRALMTSRRLGVVARWGRTFARLAPPATIVLLAVTLASISVLSPWLRSQNLSEVVATALYAENWQLIATQLEYGAAGPETSPLQHFWSLSVQAQFFVAFPIATAVVVRLFGSMMSRVVAFWSMLAFATLASFLFAWYANSVNPQAAYFNSFARFWELGIGGLIAGVLLSGRGIPSSARPYSGWLGLTMIISSGFVFDGGASYPGPAALLPVGGAVFVLLSASGGALSPTPLLSSRPLVYLDKISYGLYLWHWPVLIVYYTVRQRDGMGWRGACFVLGVSLALTLLTRLALQFPTSWAVSGRLRRVGAYVVLAVVVAAAPASLMLASSAIRNAGSAGIGECAGAAALDPERPECELPNEFDELMPAVDVLLEDDGVRDECWTNGADRAFRVCELGPPEYTKHLVAVGDSHNGQWIEAYATIAEDNGWRIDVAGRGSCGWSHSTRAQASKDLYEACDEWKSDVEDYIANQSDLDAVIVAESSNAKYGSERERVEGYVSAWSSIGGIPIIAIRDNSMFDPAIMNCVRNREYVEEGKCMVPRDVALRENGFPAAVEAMETARLVDVSDFMCTDERCPMVVGNVIVSRDGSHLTGTYVQTLAPYLGRELQAAFAR